MIIQEFYLTTGVYLRGRMFECANPTHLPVLCLAGYSRNSMDFLAIAEALSATRTVLALDTRGRGLSSWAAPDTYTAEQEAKDVLEVISQLEWPQFNIIGTSRGGILAQILCAILPERIHQIVLNDMGPSLEVEGLAAIENSLAARLNTPIYTWDDARAFLKPYAEKMFPAWHDADFEAFVQGSYQMHNGELRLAFDPALAGVFTQAFDPANPPNLWPLFEAVKHKPVMLVWGQLSNLLAEHTVHEMQDAKPDLKVLAAPGQAHPPALRSEMEIGTILNFLDSPHPGA